MIYRDERHQHTFEKEAAMRPDTVSRALLAALYLLTADRNLWNQVRDHISLRRVYVEDMRPKNLTGASYVYFAAAKDILSGTRNIQLMEIADPALLSMKSYMILCTALAIRAYGVERASRIQFVPQGLCRTYEKSISPRHQSRSDFPLQRGRTLEAWHERYGGGCGRPARPPGELG